MINAMKSNRRSFIFGASALAFTGGGNHAVGAESPPKSSFGKQSTAEDVTAGLDLSGKTMLITGCSAGIGYETLRVLVLRGAHVYALARTLEKAQRACAEVSGPSVKGRATPFACEQTDFSSVVACADAVQTLAVPIDALICNAGVSLLPKLQLAHGLEQQFVINHLSHFILVNRLLDLVRAAPQGRIVIVGSAAYLGAPEGGIEFDNLSGQRYYDPMKMYCQSKLANGLFARELARRLFATRATANVLHPGMVMTQTSIEVQRRYDPHFDLQKAIAKGQKTIEQGAATTCYVATNPALGKVSGEYFEDCQLRIPRGYMQDAALAAKLWTVSEEMTRTYLTS